MSRRPILLIHCLIEALSSSAEGVIWFLAANPKLCSQLEMETYTWEVLPPESKARNVVGQRAAEYDWTLARLAERGLANRRVF